MIPGAVIPSITTRRSIYATDFGDAPIANLSGNGWTFRGPSTNISAAVVASSQSLSGKRAELDKTVTSDARALGWDRVPATADAEILALVRYMESGAAPSFTLGGQVNVRDDASNLNYYVCLCTRSVGNNKFEIGRGDGAGGGVLVQNTPFEWNLTDLFWVRFRANGTSFKGKIWTYGTPEPTAWTIEDTDSFYGSAGAVAISTYFQDAKAAYLWFSVALNGKTAPAPGG